MTIKLESVTHEPIKMDGLKSSGTLQRANVESLELTEHGVRVTFLRPVHGREPVLKTCILPLHIIRAMIVEDAPAQKIKAVS